MEQEGKSLPCAPTRGNWHDDYEGCEREGGASAPTPKSGEGESYQEVNPTQTCRGLAFLYIIDVLGDAWYRQGC